MSDPSSPFDPRAWQAPGGPIPGPGPDAYRAAPDRPRRRVPRPTGIRIPVRALTYLLVAAAVGVVAGLAVKAWLFEPFTVPSASMRPTLTEGDRLVVEKVSFHTGTPRRGMVVVFDGTGNFDGTGDQNFYVKRVVGVGGDKVRCCDDKGRVVVNGVPVVERYLADGARTSRFKVTVPDGELFVMGDNRQNSSDSRDRGTVPVDAVVGRVFARIYPPERIADVPRD